MNVFMGVVTIYNVQLFPFTHTHTRTHCIPEISGLPTGSYEPAIDIDQQTDSNHDTALTLASAGGHDDLVELLLERGSDIEHKDKKGTNCNLTVKYMYMYKTALHV